MTELDLGKLKIQITTDGSEKASKEIKAIQDDIEEADKAIEKVGETSKKMAKTAVTAITSFTAVLIASSATTQRYREDMGKLETTFEQSGKTVESAKESYKGFYGILGESDRTVEALNHLALLCKTEEELANWTTICAGVTATFGDSLPIEGLTEAANETAKVGKVTGPLADALNWAKISEDGFNEALAKCNSEQERSALITSTLTNTYSEAGKQYQELNADVIAYREAQSELNDMWADVGATVQPVLTEVMTSVTNYVRGEMPEIKETIEDVGDTVVNFVEFISENGDEVVSAITAVGGAFVGWNVAQIIGNTVVAVKSFCAAMKTAESAQIAFNTVCNSNPYVLVASVLTALIGALVTYAVTADKAVSKTKELENGLSELKKQTNETKKSIDDKLNTDLANIEVTETMFDRLLKLDSELKTNSVNTAENTAKKAELKSLVEKLNSVSPSFKLAIDNETGALINQAKEVKSLADNYINLAKAKAYAAAYEEKAKELVKKGIDLQEILKGAEIDYLGKKSSFSKEKNEVKSGSAPFVRSDTIVNLEKSEKVYDDALKAVTDNQKEIENLFEKAAEYTKQATDITNTSGVVANNATTPYTTSHDAYIPTGTTGTTSKAKTPEELKREYDEQYNKEKQSLDEQYELKKLTFSEYITELAGLAEEYYTDGTIEFKRALDVISSLVSEHTEDEIRDVQEKLNSANFLPTAEQENLSNKYQLWLLQNRNATEHEKNAKQTELLNQTMEKDLEKKDNLLKAYDKMTELTGENSEETLALRNAISALEVTIQQTKNSLEDIKENEKNQQQANALHGMELRRELMGYGYSYKEALEMSTQAGYGLSTVINQTFNVPTATPSQVENATKSAIKDMEVQLSL